MSSIKNNVLKWITCKSFGANSEMAREMRVGDLKDSDRIFTEDPRESSLGMSDLSISFH